MTRAPSARAASVAAMVLGGGGVLIATTQPWLGVTLSQSGTVESLDVVGSDMVPGVVALGYVILALVAAILLTGPRWRTAFGAVGVLAGLGMGALLVQLQADRTAAVEHAVTEATGIAGSESVSELVAGIDATAWPVIAAVGAALSLLGSVLVLTLGRRWPVRSRRYDAQPGRAQASGSEQNGDVENGGDPVDEWDALSRGTDPTS